MARPMEDLLDLSEEKAGRGIDYCVTRRCMRSMSWRMLLLGDVRAKLIQHEFHCCSLLFLLLHSGRVEVAHLVKGLLAASSSREFPQTPNC